LVVPSRGDGRGKEGRRRRSRQRCRRRRRRRKGTSATQCNTRNTMQHTDETALTNP